MTNEGSDLVEVEVETHEGAVYKFPDMPRSMLQLIIKSFDWPKHGTLVLVNVSSAVLSLPARIVKTLSYDGEVKQHGPAVH